jgi:phosphate transport system substrate-binding protein
MHKKLVAAGAAIAVLSGVIFTGSAAQAAPQALAGKGSSFAANAMAYCAAHYDPASGDTVTYTSTGSGTGRSEFAAGNVAFAVADGGYTSGYPTSRYVNVPLLGGPVVFAYNKNGETVITKVKGKNVKVTTKLPAALKLDAATVSKILKGTVNLWNDPAIAALNKGVKLPRKTINVYYRTSGSGTTENLTNYLAQTLGASEWVKSKDLLDASDGVAGNSAGTLASSAKAKATSAVIADLVESDPWGFGYFDLSDAAAAQVNVVSLKNAAGQFVAPTAANAIRFLNAQTAIKDSTNTLAGDATDGLLTIDFTKKVANAYQLSIVTYGIAKRGSTAEKDLAVKAFFTYVVNTCMPAYASRAGYVALTGTLKQTALAQISAIG